MEVPRHSSAETCILKLQGTGREMLVRTQRNHPPIGPGGSEERCTWENFVAKSVKHVYAHPHDQAVLLLNSQQK